MNRNVLSAFYTGNDNKYGFAAYNTPPPNYLKLLSQFSYPSTRNNTIDNYFRKKETIKSMHTDFVPSQYKLPPISDKNPLIDFSKSNAQPLKPLYINSFTESGYTHKHQKSVPNTNFSPPLIKIQNIEDQVRSMEYKNKLVLQNSMKNIQNKYIGNGRFQKFLDDHKEQLERMFQENYNYQNNIQEEEDPYIIYKNENNPLEERRTKVQSKLNILKNNFSDGDEYNDFNYENLRKKKKKKHKKKRKKSQETEIENVTQSSISGITGTPKFKKRSFYSSVSSISKGRSPGRKSVNNGSPEKSLINLIPAVSTNKRIPKRRSIINFPPGKILTPNANPVTQELQKENKTLNDIINDIHSVISDLKMEIKGKLDACDINQRNIFNNYQNLLSEGGNYKMGLALHKIINKMNIDINDDPEKAKEYEENLKEMIDKKIKEYNVFRDNEDLKRKLEEEEAERKRVEIIKKIEDERVQNFISRNKFVVENLNPLIYRQGNLMEYDEDKMTQSSNKNSSSFDNKYFTTTGSKYSMTNRITNRISSQLTNKLHSLFKNQLSNKMNSQNNINTNQSQNIPLNNSQKNPSNNIIDNNNENNILPIQKVKSKSNNTNHQRTSSMKIPSITIEKVESEKEIISLHTPKTHQSGVDSDDLESSNSLEQKKSKKSKSLSKKKNRVRSPIIEATNEDI